MLILLYFEIVEISKWYAIVMLLIRNYKNCKVVFLCYWYLLKLYFLGFFFFFFVKKLFWMFWNIYKDSDFVQGGLACCNLFLYIFFQNCLNSFILIIIHFGEDSENVLTTKMSVTLLLYQKSQNLCPKYGIGDDFGIVALLMF